MDLTTIAQDVLGYVSAEGIELSQDINEAEATMQEQMRRIGSRVLEIHLAQQKLGYEGSSRACACGRTQRFVQHRPKQIATLLGPVTVQRAYYHCPACGASCLPYDEQTGLGGTPVSVGLAKAATLLAIHEPFQTAAEMLYALTGQRLCERTVERLTHAVGTVAAAQESTEAQCMKDWKAPEAQARPERLYIAVDGVMVGHRDGFHEAKTVVCYWEESDGRRVAKYAVRFESAEMFASFVWALACRCGLMHAKEVVLLGDGAQWIWDRIGGVLDGATHIVDWYHAMEHVWACGRDLYGEGSSQTETWVKEIESLLWDGNVRAILCRLSDERAQARSPTKRKALESLMTYLKNQDDRLAYERFRACGFDIGSGRVEAACKAVVGTRMKRSGMRWSARGAQATLSLRVAWLNGTWDRLWASHPLAA